MDNASGTIIEYVVYIAPEWKLLGLIPKSWLITKVIEATTRNARIRFSYTLMDFLLLLIAPMA